MNARGFGPHTALGPRKAGENLLGATLEIAGTRPSLFHERQMAQSGAASLTLGRSAWNTGGAPQPRLGQDVDDLGGLAASIAVAADKLPSSRAAFYKTQLARCTALLATGSAANILLAGKCLLDLYNDVKDELEKEDAPKPGPAPAPSGGFPVVPVALAAAAAIGLVFALKG